MNDTRISAIRQRIGDYQDFPKKGVLFRDVFPLFQQPCLLEDVIEIFVERIKSKHGNIKIDSVVGLDARGFLFGPLLALKLGASFVPIRKKGKLPGDVYSVSYKLEYGEASIEAQKSSLKPGSNVIIVDDLMATGGTMSAACQLVLQCQANIIECHCVIELTGLEGTKKLPNNTSFFSILQYEF